MSSVSELLVQKGTMSVPELLLDALSWHCRLGVLQE